MSQCVYVGVCVAVNSPACYIWIVNDITYCKTCLFYVSGLFELFCFRIVCVRMCLCVCVAVNSHASYRWIVNDITDCNSLFSVSVFLFWSSMCKVVCVGF